MKNPLHLARGEATAICKSITALCHLQPLTLGKITGERLKEHRALLAESSRRLELLGAYLNLTGFPIDLFENQNNDLSVSVKPPSNPTTPADTVGDDETVLLPPSV